MLYSIGDIHGRLDLLKNLYEQIITDIEKTDESSKIIFLGDYIDRGPDSKGVLDFLMNLHDSDKIEHIFLLGNHETFLLDAYDATFYSENVFVNWMRNGGVEALSSFNIPPVYKIFLEKFNNSYVTWLKTKTKYFHIEKDYIFAHATYSARTDFDKINEHDKMNLLWGRNRESIIGGQYFLICGHTPRSDLQVYGDTNYLCIDTGSGKSRRGVLTCVKLDPNDGNRTFKFLKAVTYENEIS